MRGRTQADTRVVGEVLSLTCRTCGRSFKSALQMDMTTFERMRIVDHFECCHLCSSVNRYQKTDYYFLADIEPEND